MVDADRPKWRAIDRNEQRMLSHRDISSRSERLSACLARCRSGGRIPPVGEITEKTDAGQIGVRSKSSARRPASDPRSRIAGRLSNKCDVAVSCPHSIFAKRLECCADQLSPPREADDRLRAEAARYQNRKNSKRRDMSFIRSPYLRARGTQRAILCPSSAPFAS